MKVLFTFFVPSGGVETLNRLRCAHLNRNGIEAHALYLRPAAGYQNTSDFPVHILGEDAGIAALLRQQAYDAIIVTSDHNMLERLRRLGYGGTLIYEVQGLGTKKEAEEYIVAVSSYLKAYADAVLLPPTDHLFQLFLTVCPWLHRYIIPNLVDLETFQYIPGERPQDPVAGWVGRLEANKNWREYLKICHLLRRSKPNLHLWMFHDPLLATGEERAAFDEELHRLGLQDRLNVFTHIPNTQMAGYYSRIADSGGLLLSTSVTEGFGYAVAEALCCTCPVVSTDSDGVRAFIVHDGTGKFYPLGSPESGAAAALELMDNPALRQAVRMQGRAHMASQFGAAGYAKSFREMLNSFGIF